MSAEIKDVLSADVVFLDVQLLALDHEARACSADIGIEIIPEGRTVNVPEGLVWKLPRERILVDSSPSRSRVMIEYPRSIDDAMLITRVAVSAITHTDLKGRQPSSFGLNFQAVYGQSSEETAVLYLGRRAFNNSALLREGWEQIGGQGKLLFRDGNRQWTVTLEPRLQDASTPNVFIDVNVHLAEQRIPPEDEMKTLLSTLWVRAHEMIEDVNGNV